ncbi:MAG: hypothetical protein A2W99_17435 [Bacteroidetes bacterium GWF2_33_16]|nr:MAG: hypothetical protein A2X00_14575 [Bacteroidetes bacterium GWE2_32_14]OFY06821.1 MAG: hypothetical protein A2W99_17435 [Bacteroidetes bacterium GWF2_33_16]
MKKAIFIIVTTIAIISCTNKNLDFNQDSAIVELNAVMDNWHYAASIADEEVFFNTLDTNAVYLGTDPKERWLKHEFEEWAMPYFQRDVAWAFKPYNRVWAFSENGEIAWFDELLETHMGICRGSGVMKKYEDGWKLKHYNLALTLPNEKMDEFRLIQGI